MEAEAPQTSTVPVAQQGSPDGASECSSLGASSSEGNPRHDSPAAGPSTPTEEAQSEPEEPEIEIAWKEWKSRRIHMTWLGIQLCVVLAMITTILILDQLSRSKSGFADLGAAPPLFSGKPKLERAIWTQGLMYTALPAFLMTLYRTAWNSSVMALAERQPYVELRRPFRGSPPKQTIMLDYRNEPFMLAWLVAFRNQHYFLSACMLSTVVLTLLVIPLTSFVFAPYNFVFNSTFDLTISTAFNERFFDHYPLFGIPDMYLHLDTAASGLLHNGSQLPWTDGTYAIPEFHALQDIGPGTVSLSTTAYSLFADCVQLPESKYSLGIRMPNETGLPAISIDMKGNDRGCDIGYALNLRFGFGHPNDTIAVWPTFSCSAKAGHSRFSIAVARYVEQNTGVTNFSLTSCQPKYITTKGRLLGTIPWDGGQRYENLSFSPYDNSWTEIHPSTSWQFFEKSILVPGIVDQSQRVDANNAFSRNAYRLSLDRSPDSPLDPRTIRLATQDLYSRTFAAFAAAELFQKSDNPQNSTGTYTVEQPRLIVVSPIAYIILVPLSFVALLTIGSVFSARQNSILTEEPVGLLSAAGLIHRSEDFNDEMEPLLKDSQRDGRITAAARRSERFARTWWYYSESQRRIMRYIGP
jgi:hypothetical protein